MRLPLARRFVTSGVLVPLLACSSDGVLAPHLELARRDAMAAPSGLVAADISDRRIDLEWRDNAPNETGFEVHRSSTGATGTFDLLAVAGASTTSREDDDLTPLTRYCYKVRAVVTWRGRTYRSEFSNTACATTRGAPSAPTGFSARPEDVGIIALTWDTSATAYTYLVQRFTTGPKPWPIVLETSNPSWLDIGREAEQQLCYRVIAVNDYGASEPSLVECTALPAPPADLVAVPTALGAIDLAWSDASAFEDGYAIHRSSNEEYSPATILNVPANATSYRDGTANPDQRYWYRVRPLRDLGFSGFSNTASVIVARAAPAAPTSILAVPQSSTSIRVSWYDYSLNEERFRVERSTDGGVAWTSAGTAEWTAMQQSFVDEGRVPDQRVHYRVIGVNGIGESPPSPIATTVTPRAPTDAVATAVGSHAIDLRWTDASTVEDGYVVRRLTCDDYYGEVYCYFFFAATLPAGTTSWRDTTVAASTTYTYQVVAFKTEGGTRGYSDPSNSVSARTP